MHRLAFALDFGPQPDQIKVTVADHRRDVLPGFRGDALADREQGLRAGRDAIALKAVARFRQQRQQFVGDGVAGSVRAQRLRVGDVLHEHDEHLEIEEGLPRTLIAGGQPGATKAAGQVRHRRLDIAAHAGLVGAAIEPQRAGAFGKRAVAMADVESGPRFAVEPHRRFALALPEENAILRPAFGHRHVDAEPALLPGAAGSAKELTRRHGVEALHLRHCQADGLRVDGAPGHGDVGSAHPARGVELPQQMSGPAGNQVWQCVHPNTSVNTRRYV